MASLSLMCIDNKSRRTYPWSILSLLVVLNLSGLTQQSQVLPGMLAIPFDTAWQTIRHRKE